MSQEIRTTEDLMNNLLTKHGPLKLKKTDHSAVITTPTVEQPTEQPVEQSTEPVSCSIPTNDFPSEDNASTTPEDKSKKKTRKISKKPRSVELLPVQQQVGCVKQHSSTTKPLPCVNISTSIDLENLVIVYEKSGKFFMEKTITGWRPYSVPNTVDRYTSTFFRKDKDGNEFCILKHVELELRQMGHAVAAEDLTYSFGDIPPGKFNLLIKDFCEMVPTGEYNDWFDVLLRSICNNDPEKIEHLEKVIWLKYKYPSNTQIPCPVLLDQGGCGKGLLVEELMPTIFGQDAVLKNLSTKRFLDKFANFAGKVIININEAGFKRGDMNELKMKIGASALQVEKKFHTAVECPNTGLFIITSNATNDGAIQLAGNTVDRRWSIFVNKDKTHNLKFWIEDYLGHEITTEEHLTIVADEIIPVLQSREEVGKWLYALSIKHGGITKVAALMAGDYNTLLHDQQQTWERVCDHVFNNLQPGVITSTELYEYYKTIHRDGGNDYSAKNNRAFGKSVSAWLEENNMPYKSALINDRCGMVKTTKNGYVREGVSATIRHEKEYTKLVCVVNNITKTLWSLDEYPNQPLYLQNNSGSGKTASATITRLKQL